MMLNNIPWTEGDNKLEGEPTPHITDEEGQAWEIAGTTSLENPNVSAAAIHDLKQKIKNRPTTYRQFYTAIYNKFHTQWNRRPV